MGLKRPRVDKRDWKGRANSSWGGAKEDTKDGEQSNESQSKGPSGSFTIEQLKENAEEWDRRIVAEKGGKRKYAVCFGYLGSSYQGLQSNPDCNSVEMYVEKALFLAGGITEENFGYLQKIQWSRAARTDRGVHANSQCCAMRLSIPTYSPSEDLDTQRNKFVESINSFLPADIRAHFVTKVTKSFNAKNMCDRRKYHYMLPSYVFKNRAELLSIMEEAYTEQGPMPDVTKGGRYSTTGSDKHLGPEALHGVRNNVLVKNHRASEAEVSALRDALKCYVGSHKFHNFTAGKTPSDADASRYILSFDCSAPFVDENTGVEWVLLTVLGQSFLLNQIRKMVGLAAEIAAGVADPLTVSKALSNSRVDVPMITGLGLYLEELYFESYNNKLASENKKISSKTNNVNNGSKKIGPDETVSGEKRRHDGTSKVSGDSIPADGVEMHELLQFTDSGSAKKLQTCRESVIWPHVYAEEKENLHFLYYLDNLRVWPRTYCEEVWKKQEIENK